MPDDEGRRGALEIHLATLVARVADLTAQTAQVAAAANVSLGKYIRAVNAVESEADAAGANDAELGVSLTEALAKLRAAGCVRSPWLPGMLLRDGDGLDYMRVHAVDEEGPWFVDQDGDERDPMGMSAVIAIANWPLDLEDPATLGCVTALWFEAFRAVYAAPGADLDKLDRIFEMWAFVSGGSVDDRLQRQGSALREALVALAEAS